ncbi:copper-binding protein [Massilia sp.]|uniref:copper-binding protein n=1 Tax=Massilia sp. TaxID=1882437 RepID=UPI0028A96178|nr:copper-binding protein [Massilia sp.]
MKTLSTLTLAIAMAAATPFAPAQEGGHAGHGAHDAHAAHASQAAPALTDGEVKKIDKETGKITLRHGEIRNLNMAAMTMVFRVKDAAMLEQVNVGDKIRFAADRDNGAVAIVQLEKAQ